MKGVWIQGEGLMWQGQVSIDLRANLRERALMPDLPLEVAWPPCRGSWRALCRDNDSDLER